MCKSCQRCWEDFYWNCIEEKFCYDESIANYNPAEDEYFTKNSGNGFKSQKNNGSSPIITIQPSGGGHHTIERQNSKIHEEDYRQVQTTCPILATEILKVFSNSQIFHENQSHKKTLSGLPGVHSSSNLKAIKISGAASPGVTGGGGGGGGGGRESDNEKLLIRLEGNKDSSFGTDNNNTTSVDSKKIHFTIDGYSDDTSPFSSLNSIPPSNPMIFPVGKGLPNTDHGVGHSGGFSVIREEEDENGEIILKPQNIITQDTDNCNELPPMNHKHLRNVQSVPQFIFRPASENDIYSISGGGGGGSTNRMNSMSQISMTPEIPSISYSTLPKNYETTPPRLDKYIDTPSLYSIQLENTARVLEQDLSMPRFFGKSDKIGGHHSLDQLLLMNRNIQQKKHVEVKSKRLEAMRTKLPPLTLHRDRSLKDHHQHQQQQQQHGSQKHH